MARAFGWQPKGRGFESPQLHLLAQPDHSERFVAIEIRDALDALSIPEAENVRDLRLQLYAADAPETVGTEEGNDLVPGIEHLLEILGEVLPILLERREVLAHAGVAPNGPAAERGQVRTPLDIRVELREQGVDVSAAPGGIDSLGGFYVRARHWPKR